MQIDSKTNIIETAGLGATGGFSIKTTAAAFQLLSSGLYSNKIRAVVRELSSNAVDAHTMVQNQTRPIEVKIPNALDRDFYVKDFGPGLSHDDIMHMYTTYFDSSKQSSNDFIGGFGVGSKSPFAYTDSFTVESRHKGQRRLYSAFIGEENTPQIAEIGVFDMEAGEENGLTVSMPVKPTDFSAFEREAMDLFKWFDVQPVLRGTPNSIQKPAMTQVMPGISWRASAHYSDNIAVRMGQVVYSIEKYKNDSAADENVARAMRGLARFHPLLDVPIGSMSVAASREEIAYDKKTKEYLNQRLPEVYQLAMKEVVAKLQAFDLSQQSQRIAAFDFLQQYHLQSFCSEKKVDELIATQRSVPDLNLLLREQKVSADPFLPILRGLDPPTAQQKTIVQASMPYNRDKVENWFGTGGTFSNRWDDSSATRSVAVLEIDMPLNSIYTERARKNWLNQRTSHVSKTIALRPVPGADTTQYLQTRNAMLDNWGLKPSSVVALSTLLAPEDALKYKKTQGLQSVPASTFFTNRPSICTSDLKSFYYIEQDTMERFVPPQGWDASVFKKLVDELQENATLSKAFLKDGGADQATLSRVYTIKQEDIEKAKAFPGARSFNDVLAGVLDNTAFRAAWEARPLRREEKEIAVAKLFSPNRYHANGTEIVENLKKTQLGQALAWLNSIPQWSYQDNGKRPDDVQYAVLGGLLSDASKTANPLPGKFMDAELIANRVEKYYPMIASAMDKYAYFISGALGEEIVHYSAWKDSTASAPFLAGVTTLPGAPAVLDIELQSAASSIEPQFI